MKIISFKTKSQAEVATIEMTRRCMMEIKRTINSKGALECENEYLFSF